MKNRLLLVSMLVVVMVLMTGAYVHAQSGGPYELTWTSNDAGGGAMTGGAYTLVSSIGQPEPGSTQSGGGYSLNGGTVDAGSPGQTAPGGQRVFLPLVLR